MNERILKAQSAYDIAEMKPQHSNIAVAMVAACIVHYANRKQLIERIYLHPAYYKSFKTWVREMFGEDYADAEDYCWHGVPIVKEKFLSGKPMYFELKKNLN